MGSKICKQNVLLVGDEGVGKSTLLYFLKLKEYIFGLESTDAFNYEVIVTPKNGHRFDLHFWDLAGRDDVQCMWKHFYEHTTVNVVTYVINANRPGELGKHVVAVRRLMHERPLRRAKFVVLLNVFDPSSPQKLEEGEVSRMILENKNLNIKVQPARLAVLEVNARNGDGLDAYTNELCLIDFGITEPPQRI
jgi:small GTP-binding protein